MILLYLMASSTSMSSFRLIGAGRLRQYAGESSLGVSFTLNSSFMPLPNRCLAKMPWNSTSNSSILSISRAREWNLSSQIFL